MGNSKKNETAEEKLPALPILRNQRRWDITKVVLRSLCLTLSVIDVAELIALDTVRQHLIYSGWVAYPVLAALLLWDIIEFVVIIVRRNISKGIPPGAHIGVELILWLGSITTVAVEALFIDWGELVASDQEQIERDVYSWARVALTQFSFLSFLLYVFPNSPNPTHRAAVLIHLVEAMLRAFDGHMRCCLP
ncbi:hypothetical protein HD806DRAFT_402383 [Xylariaceae sp. AK1471]|nr:hypothetical protein HD806DRAFT_402383 [Xylariaceae sp. AK1471]